MEFFKQNTKIDFMGQKKAAMFFSIALLLLSLGILWVNGLHLGLDFTGGTQIELHSTAPIQLDTLRTQLKAQGFPEVTLQTYGTTHQALMRLASHPDTTQAQLKTKLEPILKPHIQIDRLEFIGPQVGKALLNNGILAIIVSMLATMAYIALRFESRFAISAAISLIHDPVLILGVFSLFGLDFDLIALAALLTILGYSLNDTIVVYDRIRENFRLFNKKTPVEIVNLSINQTLSRTIMTSGLTLLVVLSLCFFGGETLRGFSIALSVGILIGTYSSIYVAGALAVVLGLNKEALAPKKRLNINTLQV